MAVSIGFDGRFLVILRKEEKGQSLLAYALANSSAMDKEQSGPCLAIQYTFV